MELEDVITDMSVVILTQQVERLIGEKSELQKKVQQLQEAFKNHSEPDPNEKSVSTLDKDDPYVKSLEEKVSSLSKQVDDLTETNESLSQKYEAESESKRHMQEETDEQIKELERQNEELKKELEDSKHIEAEIPQEPIEEQGNPKNESENEYTDGKTTNNQLMEDLQEARLRINSLEAALNDYNQSVTWEEFHSMSIRAEGVASSYNRVNDAIDHAISTLLHSNIDMDSPLQEKLDYLLSGLLDQIQESNHDSALLDELNYLHDYKECCEAYIMKLIGKSDADQMNESVESLGERFDLICSRIVNLKKEYNNAKMVLRANSSIQRLFKGMSPSEIDESVSCIPSLIRSVFSLAVHMHVLNQWDRPTLKELEKTVVRMEHIIVYDLPAYVKMVRSGTA